MVYRARNLVDGQIVALKKIQIFDMVDAKARQDCIKEIDLLKVSVTCSIFIYSMFSKYISLPWTQVLLTLVEFLCYLSIISTISSRYVYMSISRSSSPTIQQLNHPNVIMYLASFVENNEVGV